MKQYSKRNDMKKTYFLLAFHNKFNLCKHNKILQSALFHHSTSAIFKVMIYKNILKIPKGQSKAVNRRTTDNTISTIKKENRTNNDLQNTTQRT